MHTHLIDTTLRDGEQAPGVVFSGHEKMRIAEMLHELGVDEVEAGTPAIGADEREVIKRIANAGFRFKTSCWCRANTKDILEAATLQTQSINISLPTSDIQIDTLGKSRYWVLKQLKETVALAVQYFPHVTMGAQDGSRADIDFLNEFIFYSSEAGAKRIRISDTVGIADPLQIAELFKSVAIQFPDISFEFHGHNDLGMATANSVAAIRGGASCISATVNGLGERAGNAVLEEVVAWLQLNQPYPKYNTHGLSALSSYVAMVSQQTLPHNKPVTGEGAYRHESGIHTSAMLRNKSAYQILNPRHYGLKSESFVYGKHSGKAAIVHFFQTKGIELNEAVVQYILHQIKQRSTLYKESITDENLLSIYSDTFKLASFSTRT